MALALERSNFVKTDSSIETGSSITFIQVLLTSASLCSRWARAGEISNQIIASSSIETRVWITVIDIVFALGSHEPLGAVAAEG